MGWTSEMVAQSFDVPREKQDYYALISHSRAEKVKIEVNTRKCVVRNLILLVIESRNIQRRDYSN